jgi:polyphenol oxidase
VELIAPDWPAPPNVRAAMTTRALDVGTGHAADRERLRAALQLPAEPGWLRQVHGTRVAQLPGGEGTEADASYATTPGVVCAALAADCLPVLFCDDAGAVVAAAHAGWRGLAAGILEATIRALPVSSPASLMAWMGAAIGPASFEVGAEVREAFVSVEGSAAACFAPLPVPGKFLADLYALARQRLNAAGVRRVYGGGFDTFTDSQRFFSYRRDGRCGRMAALVWRAR